MSDILIYRALPIINGYLRIPPCRESDKTKVTVEQAENAPWDAGASPPASPLGDWGTNRLTLGSGNNTGSHFGSQQFFVLPPLAPGVGYTKATEPIGILTTGR